MGLGISIASDVASSGSRPPLLSYNAKAGRLKQIDRVQTGDGWQSVETDLTFQQPHFVMDLECIQVGWQLFRKGQAPSMAMVNIGQPMPPCPSGDFGADDKGNAYKHKQGFTLRVLDKDKTVREISGNSGAILGSIDALHTAYASANESKQGLLPVVQFAGANEVKGAHGSNYAPIFNIVRWISRPAELPKAGAAAASPAPAAHSPANHVPPPSAQPPAAAAAPAEDLPF